MMTTLRIFLCFKKLHRRRNLCATIKLRFSFKTRIDLETFVLRNSVALSNKRKIFFSGKSDNFKKNKMFFLPPKVEQLNRRKGVCSENQIS